uniref:Uncharacterized protein n=1 Tax=Streptomyces sp. FR1 TaxID=349971 RepID=V9Z2V5_9ACTN|nr:hypothetical protein pFRL3_100 [Streptomyces sp. FR1]
MRMAAGRRRLRPGSRWPCGAPELQQPRRSLVSACHTADQARRADGAAVVCRTIETSGERDR